MSSWRWNEIFLKTLCRGRKKIVLNLVPPFGGRVRQFNAILPVCRQWWTHRQWSTTKRMVDVWKSGGIEISRPNFGKTFLCANNIPGFRNVVNDIKNRIARGSIIRRVLTYGCETRTMTAVIWTESRGRLKICIRRRHGGSWWWSRYNKEAAVTWRVGHGDGN